MEEFEDNVKRLSDVKESLIATAKASPDDPAVHSIIRTMVERIDIVYLQLTSLMGVLQARAAAVEEAVASDNVTAFSAPTPSKPGVPDGEAS